MTARKPQGSKNPEATTDQEVAPEQVATPEPQPEPEPAPPEPQPGPQEPQQQPEPIQQPVQPTAAGMVYFLPTSNTSGTTTESGASFALASGVPVKMTAADAAALVAEGLGSIQGE